MVEQTTKQITDGKRHWYTLQTYSGYEDAVTRNLMQRRDSMGMENLIFDVVVPTEKKIVVKGGKRVEIREKIYPGYVLVDMIVTDESWYVARNTPRVTGFVGSGTHPVPLTEQEVETLFARMEADTTKHAIDLSIGDAVTITDGPFKELEGKVGSIDEERGKVKVMVPMFGRDTPVELDFVQVNLI
ncbi:MAG: transcription termination/antitermination protein NusG [Candidatus Pacebacteria bacterium]|nr:transcription termination/antitermination protein NusG [Candidatus Paceibacterota bacterium]